MIWFLVFVFAIAACNAAPTEEDLPVYGIVGGGNADIIHYPYQVSILYGSGHWCGGSILSTTKIVTAAHCTFGKNEQSFKVRAGATMRDRDGQVVNVKRVINHPNYKEGRAYNNDVAVLILESPLQFGPGVQAIKLATGSLPYGKTAYVTGWGATKEGGFSAKHLQYADAVVFTEKECADVYKNRDPLTKNMFCAGHMAAGRDACQGDSGGPLAHNNELIGVVSWGVGCARANLPGVYASVPQLASWIEAQ